MYVSKATNKRLFPVLEFAIYEKGIKKKAIADKLHISQKALFNKLNGVSPFTWNEICIIQEQFFPDISKETLLQTNKERAINERSGAEYLPQK